jgi:hypothetical protein
MLIQFWLVVNEGKPTLAITIVSKRELDAFIASAPAIRGSKGLLRGTLAAAQIAGAPVDQCRFRPTQRMRAKQFRIKSDACQPFREKPVARDPKAKHNCSSFDSRVRRSCTLSGDSYDLI